MRRIIVLVILVTGLNVSCNVQQDEKMRTTAKAALEKMGCDVSQDAAGKAQSIHACDLVFSSGNVGYLGAFPELRILSFANCVHDDSIWPVLAKMRDLEELTLRAGFATDSKGPKEIEFRPLEDPPATARGVSDNGSQVLRGFSRLMSLDLNSTHIGDATLANIGQLNLLEKLDLFGKRITGRGLANISGLRNLTRISLVGTAVDDIGLASLSGMAKLTTLELESTKITDAGLPHLRGLAALKCLSIQYTAVTENGLASLRPLEKLETIYCSVPTLTDVGIQALRKLRSLRYLYLNRSMTIREFRHLQAELPMVYINDEISEHERRSADDRRNSVDEKENR